METDIASLRKAAEGGDRLCQTALGSKYRDGDGVPKSLVKAFWWYEKASFIDWAAVDTASPAPSNYASLCEELILLGYGPVRKFFMRSLIRIEAWLVEYSYYKEPNYILGKIWRKIKKFPKAFATGMGEVLWELLIIFILCLIVTAIILFVRGGR